MAVINFVDKITTGPDEDRSRGRSPTGVARLPTASTQTIRPRLGSLDSHRDTQSTSTKHLMTAIVQAMSGAVGPSVQIPVAKRPLGELQKYARCTVDT